MQKQSAAANASAAFAAVLFGASVVAVRIAVRDVPPLTLALLRFGQGSLALFVYLALFRRDLLRIERRDLGYLALLGAIFFTVFPVTFNAGLRYIEASRAALLIATMPLWSLLIGRFAARERLSGRQIVGVLTSVAGVGIVMLHRGAAGSGALKGDLLLLTTALCGAIYNVLAKRMVGRYTGLTVTFYAMVFGTLLLAPASLVEHAPRLASLGTETLVMVILLGILGGAVSFSLWTAALRYLSPTQVAVYININPMAATLLAAVMLHEHLSASFVLGFAAVAAGVMIVNWTRAPVRVESLAVADRG
jgi:drug/metabolite transporter (DMT)-like permease